VSYENNFKRQGQQHKTSNNKKRKLSTKITPHLEEGNRKTEQERAKYLYLNKINLLLPEFPWP
jgi:vacuolar-type H+-ATPase subunit I/STV1